MGEYDAAAVLDGTFEKDGECVPCPETQVTSPHSRFLSSQRVQSPILHSPSSLTRVAPSPTITVAGAPLG